MLVTSFCPCLTTYLCLFLVRFAIFDFSDTPYVLSGEIEVVTLDGSVSLRLGEGIFLNKNVVHLVRKNDSCHYKSFVFPDYFLELNSRSPATASWSGWWEMKISRSFISKTGRNIEMYWNY